MRLIFVPLLLISSLLADDFITRMEYAKLLYLNPRGIGCDKCHGSDAKGKVIAFYKQKGETKRLAAPPINNVTKDVFLKALNNPKTIMPKYSLTDEEMQSLYEYVTKQP
ncbi:MAG: cytochrome c [Campylobacteraceae bacterium]|jgi:mono/diheme cytochrome c family protein|nr:cytochrome c [Campylobacteraceae bacterium]